MTDMIEGLSKAALEVGTDSASHLVAPQTVLALGEQVRSGRRRRRLRAAAGVGVVAVMIGAAAVVVPRLNGRPELFEPAATPPAVISSVGNLTVFDDGSMSLYTQRGTFVDFAAPAEGDDATFEQVSKESACSFDGTAAEPGWNFYSEEARQVILFARPQAVGPQDERSPASQGDTLDLGAGKFAPYLALTMDAEVATAPQLGIRQTLITTVLTGEPGVPGEVLGYGIKLDAAPAVTISGDADSVNRLATVEANAVTDPSLCHPDALEHDKSVEGVTRLRHYLIADVFLLDRAGHARLLATHTSWVNTVVEP